MSLGSLPSLAALPPLNMLLLVVGGALLGRRQGGRLLVWVGLAGLVVSSLPVVSGALLAMLELGLPDAAPVGDGSAGAGVGAIVVLSGDQEAIKLGQAVDWRVGQLTLEREQAGAALARVTHLPVLVSGGAVHPWSPPLAGLMADSMARDFGVKVRWQEAASQDTWENARNSAVILRDAGVRRAYVVTQAWHLRRAMLAFRRAGIDAVPAPVLIDAKPDFHAASFIPSVRGWLETYFATHELMGWGWYWVRP